MYYKTFSILCQPFPGLRRYISMRSFLIIMALVSTTACAQVPVHVSTDYSARPRIPRIKLLRSNPHRFTTIRLQGTNPYDAPDDDFICSGTARRPKVVNPPDAADDSVSDYVAVRLAVARARAMQKYREVQASNPISVRYL
jgi:hypothetical protein